MCRRIVLAGNPSELLSLSMLSSAAEVAPMACRSLATTVRSATSARLARSRSRIPLT